MNNWSNQVLLDSVEIIFVFAVAENSHHNHMFNEETLSETVRAKEQVRKVLLQCSIELCPW